MMNAFPLPNLNVGAAGYNRFNKWIGTGSNASTNDQLDGKIEWRISDADLLSGKVAWGRSPFHNANCFGNALDPCGIGPGVGGPKLGAINWTHTFNPTTLLTASLGSTRSFTD
jgi:hypothetical protein